MKPWTKIWHSAFSITPFPPLQILYCPQIMKSVQVMVQILTKKTLKIILNCFALPQGIAMSFLKSSFHMAKTCFNYYQLVEQRETKNQHSPKQRNLLCLLLLPQLPPQFLTSLQQIKIHKDLLGRGTAKHTCLSSFQSGLVWQIPVSAQPKPTHQYQIWAWYLGQHTPFPLFFIGWPSQRYIHNAEQSFELLHIYCIEELLMLHLQKHGVFPHMQPSTYSSCFTFTSPSEKSIKYSCGNLRFSVNNKDNEQNRKISG